jgi:hypothetical protein
MPTKKVTNLDSFQRYKKYHFKIHKVVCLLWTLLSLKTMQSTFQVENLEVSAVVLEFCETEELTTSVDS